jgi:hypothetical protein
MTTLPRLSEESEESFNLSESSSTKRGSNKVNFSRPRRTSDSTARSYLSYDSDSRSSNSKSTGSSGNGRSNVHAISAFHQPKNDFPDEPRMSIDSDLSTIMSSDNSAYAWDGEREELRYYPRPKGYDRQRYDKNPRPPPPRNGSHDSRTALPARSSRSVGTSSSSNSKEAGILKRVSFDQHSERISIPPDIHEDEASHHTVSDEEDEGALDAERQWQSSKHDTSNLSDAEIRKLMNKGVNPNLYAEMRAAKKGRSKIVGPLLGNAFLG